MKRQGDGFHDGVKQDSIQIMEDGFCDSQYYRKVKINGEYHDARMIPDSKTTIRGGNGNWAIQFRHNVRPTSGTYIDIPNYRDVYDKWLIVYESDDLAFPKHLIKKCNYLLKWKNFNNEIIERWCVFGDNTRIQDGVSYVAENKLKTPYSSQNLILPYDTETINLKFGDRFLVGDFTAQIDPEAWAISNRNIVSKRFGELSGVIELNLARDYFNKETDSKQHMIAGYYVNYDSAEKPSETIKATIEFNGTSTLKMGMPYKKYKACLNVDSLIKEQYTCTWEISFPDGYEEKFEYEITNDVLSIRSEYCPELLGKYLRLKIIFLNNENQEQYESDMLVKVVSSI